MKLLHYEESWLLTSGVASSCRRQAGTVSCGQPIKSSVSLQGNANRENYLTLLSSVGKLIVAGFKRLINNLSTVIQTGGSNRLFLVQSRVY